MKFFTIKRKLLFLSIFFNFLFAAEQKALEENKAQEVAKEIVDNIPQETIENMAADVETEIASKNQEDDQEAKKNCCKKFLDTLSPRAILKAITWRITGTIDTVVIAYILTNHIGNSLAIGSVELVTKFVLYYLHERVWGCISWRRGQG